MKKESDEPNKLDHIVDLLNKKYGKCSYRSSDDKPDPPRLPSGIFIVDYMTGGGFPMNQFTILRGPEHGGKTSLAMSAMSMVPKICWRCFKLLEQCECSLPPILMKSVWADVEGTFNGAWAEAIGNQDGDYWLERADSGNMFGELLDYALRADDCGLVVLDSIGALTTSDEIDGSLEGAIVASQARLVGRMARKLRQRLITEHRREHPCLVIFTNQLRMNIGVMFGNPETSPGGHQIRHESALTLRISKRATEDKYKDKEKEILIAQRHHVTVEKYKNFRLIDVGEFIRATANREEMGLTKGWVLDQAALLKYGVQHGVINANLTEKGKIESLEYEGEVGKERAFIALLRKNKSRYLKLSQEIITKAKTEGLG